MSKASPSIGYAAIYEDSDHAEELSAKSAELVPEIMSGVGNSGHGMLGPLGVMGAKFRAFLNPLGTMLP